MQRMQGGFKVIHFKTVDLWCIDMLHKLSSQATEEEVP